ncbi:MAG: hypothetical protein WBO70_07475 [Erysipelotrichaceae bacterium]
MKIANTKEINQFFQRCNKNKDIDYNQFLDAPITKNNENKTMGKLAKNHHPLYQTDTYQPTLFLSTKEYLKNSYLKNINLSQIRQADCFYEPIEILPNRLFNYDEVIDDPKKELNDYLILKALDTSYKTPCLWQNDEPWMLIVPPESNTIDKHANNAYGNVLTFGLGLGYFVYMALLNPKVVNITVIEKDQTIIDMFYTYILPQFTNQEKITIIQDDAFNCFNHRYLKDYDYIFIDIWKNNEDGAYLIEKLLEQYNPNENVHYWIEGSCLHFMHFLIFDYLFAVYQNKENTNKTYNTRINKKIDIYFKKHNQTITDVNQLKHLIYNRQIIKDILSIKGN